MICSIFDDIEMNDHLNFFHQGSILPIHVRRSSGGWLTLDPVVIYADLQPRMPAVMSLTSIFPLFFSYPTFGPLYLTFPPDYKISAFQYANMA